MMPRIILVPIPGSFNHSSIFPTKSTACPPSLLVYHCLPAPREGLSQALSTPSAWEEMMGEDSRLGHVLSVQTRLKISSSAA